MRKYLSLILIAGALGLLLIVVGCRSRQRTAEEPAPTVTSTASVPPEQVKIGPDEASCPVLGTVMKKADMIPLQHDGKTYYMCCRDCVAKFKADPEKYIKHPATPTNEMPHN